MKHTSLPHHLVANILGGVRITWQGKKLTDFATQKVLGLFCYLLDHRHQSISRDRLITMFWGEFPENQARYNLRYALWNIRKLFKEIDERLEPIDATRNECQLNSNFPIITDVQLFEEDFLAPIGKERLPSLIRAAELYRGKFLDGFTLRNLEEWEEWLYHRREDLQKKALDVFIEIGQNFLEQHHYTKAIEYYMRALSFQNDVENAHEGIIRAYASLGKSSSALRQYSTYVEIMQREYHAPPRASISQLAELIRSGQFQTSDDAITQLPNISVDPSDNPLDEINFSQEEVDNDPIDPVDSNVNDTVKSQFSNEKGEVHHLVSSFYTSTEFIGRKNELFHLHQTIDSVEKDKIGHVVIISGEMGIGKTRLFQRFLEEVKTSILIGQGENDEISSSQPLETIFQILRSFKKNKHLPPSFRSELDLFLKFQPTSQYETETERNFIEPVRKWIISLSEYHTVLIAIDDLHWANEQVLGFFASIAQETKRNAIILVGIFRTFEVTTEDTIAASLISLARTGRLVRIELKKMNDDETIALINSRATRITEQLNRQDLVKLSRYSCGIPLFAVELANFLLEENFDFLSHPLLDDQPDFTATSLEKLIPPLLLKITNLRLSKLSEASLTLIKTISLLIGEFPIDFIRVLMGLDEDAIEEQLVDLEARNFIHHIERGNELFFAFNHQLVKIAITETISTLERRRIYKTIVTATQDWDGEFTVESLSYYYFQSGDQLTAVQYLIESAKQWFALGDKSKCLYYSTLAYKSAIEHLPTHPEKVFSVLLNHADFLVKFEQIKDALIILEAILHQADSQKSMTASDGISSKRDELRRLLRAKPNKKISELPPLVLITTKRSLANVKILQDDLEGAKQLLNQAEKSLEVLPDGPETFRESGLLLQVKAQMLLKGDKPLEAMKVLGNSIDLLTRDGLPSELIDSMLLLGNTFLINQQVTKAKSIFEKCKTICRKEGDEVNEAYCHYYLGIIAFQESNLLIAQSNFERAIELAELQSHVTVRLGDYYMEYSRLLYVLNQKKQSKEYSTKSEQIYTEANYNLGIEKLQHFRKRRLLL